ncbi:type I polyketide synthase [Dietzia cinnamea]|uniref:Fatty acid synthase n=2 Tax=Dietzia TaxID=37914 RepID=A0A4R3ZZS9_9ACTN|nr:type I polyketide synthase [Dietzia cinnamea]TCW26751.1 fatty acid synthase [Dietzia cinnamea]
MTIDDRDLTPRPIETGFAARSAARALADELREGTAYALAFGGQGIAWRDALSDLIDGTGIGPELQDLVDASVALTEPVHDEIAVVRTHGFRPIEWANTTTGEDEDAADLPDDASLSAAAVSLPAVLLTQMGALRALAAEGFDVNDTAPAAVVGHSQGVLAVESVETFGSIDDRLLAVAELIGAAATLVGRRVGLFRRGQASPMVGVSGIDGEALRSLVDELFSDVDASIRPSVSIRNAQRRHVVVGRPDDLEDLRRHCADLEAESRRRREAKLTGGEVFAPVFDPLDVEVGFHHPAMAPAVEIVSRWARACDLDVERAVHLARQVFIEPVDWVEEMAEALHSGAQWVLDMGPGEALTRLNRSVVRGQGVGVVAAATRGGLRNLFTPGATPPIERPWTAFQPQLITLPDGSVHVETSFTRLTGRSPILLAGMTPTTVDPQIVAAAANAGHWAELAGGGQVSEAIFAENTRRLAELLEPGRSAQFNSLFLDPYLWKMQVGGKRLVQRARAAGIPFDGVIVTAGIPELDESVALIEELTEAGLRYVSFKPGTVAQIRQVVRIAAEVPHMPVIVQVEGGRAGGHHSWEDLDALLLSTYGELRERPNVVLCVGGGIGTPERAADYLTGSWANAHGYPAMPVDGILVGTAAMATLEATTSPQVKQLLVDTTGVDAWVGAGQAEGGMASGRSQLGADIHEIDNTAARTGRLLDEVAGDAEAVAARRDEIIAAINGTAKPYFGDLDSMTYEQWLRRFVELSLASGAGAGGSVAGGDDSFDVGGDFAAAVADGTRSVWLDPTIRERFHRMVQRTEARLDAADSGRIRSAYPRVESMERPAEVIDALAARYPELASAVLHPADAAEFLDICRMPGKPVPFVPVVDADVRRWWRSDSLWQAHDPRYDADAVCVIPGTTAVAGITRVDEPVGELLDRFEAATADRVRGYLPATEAVSSRRRGVVTTATGPVADVLNSPDVTWAGRLVVNPVHRLGVLQAWEIDADGIGRHPVSGAVLTPDTDGQTVDLTLPIGPAEMTITLTVGDAVATGAAPVVTDDAAESAMRTLLATAAGVGRGGAGGTRIDALPEVTDGVATARFTFEPTLATDHTGVTAGSLPTSLVPSVGVPDALVGAAWPTVFAVLGQTRRPRGTGTVVEGLLDLVHLDHGVRMHAALPQETTDLVVVARSGGVRDTDLGRVVEVSVEVATEARDGSRTPLCTLSERFAIRGRTGGAEVGDPRPAGGALVTPSGGVVEPAETTRQQRVSATLTAPHDMTAFALVSGDHNPIHVSDTAAELAGLGGVIVHGMWLSAAAQHAVQASDGKTPALRIAGWTARMLAPVRPGDHITVRAVQTGRHAGGQVLEVTCTVDGATVMAATALTEAPRTVYAFPGQGIQAKGMGMEGRTRCPAAREIWDRADKHTREALGFSILALVRDNPTEVTVRGEVHRHPDGVLYLTQFTQVAMACLAVAQRAELEADGLLVDGAYFAGHSIGEYDALAAISGVLELEPLLEIVFQRGSTMHQLVPRDAQGRSDYRMAAIRPSQMGISDEDIAQWVADVARESGEFIEIVNYNLAGSQYALAGTVAGCAALEKAVNRELERSGGKNAFILVPGIDVPFHSTVLRGGVPDFRATLDALIPEDVDISVLVGRYIPNLVPRLFSLERDFVQEIADLVPAEALDDVLANWDAWAATPTRLGRLLLVELLAWQFASPVRWIETQELLFTPIERGGLGVEQFIEVGVANAPTVANLASKTLDLPTHRGPRAQVINVERDSATLYGTLPPSVEVDDDETDTGTGSASTPAAGQAAPTDPAPAVNTPGTAGADRSEPAAAPAAAPGAPRPDDLEFGAPAATRMLVALRTKVRPEQIAAGDSIETLCDGVSSRRNQLLLDLGTELSLGAIDGAAEADFPTLADQVSRLARGYAPFGPVLSDAVGEALRAVLGRSGKRPAYITERVTGAWELGAGWAHHVTAEIALGTRDGASIRGGDLATLDASGVKDVAGLDALIDAAVQAVGAAHGVSVAMPSSGAGGGGVVDSAALTEFADELTGRDGVLAEAARGLLTRLGHLEPEAVDLLADADPDSELADLVAAELGSDWRRVVAPAFDANRAVLLDDRWASAREDLARLWTASDVPADAAEAFRGAGEIVAEQARWWAARATDARRDALATAFRQISEAAAEEFVGEYADDVAVVTGAGKGSIAAAVTGRLLAGGATVVATTSSLDQGKLAFFKDLYRSNARGGAALWVLPANMTSYSDVDALVEWVGSEHSESAGGQTTVLKPALTPTLLFPFAAPRVQGSMADAGPRAETEMRVLLWSVEKLVAGLGAIGADTDVDSRLHVVLPGSPNRGIFGGDGAYGEAKAALDAMIAKWGSEKAWSQRVTFVHAIIGWVRGTGLMGHNDPLVEAVEAAGVSTWSTAGMATELLRWCAPEFRDAAAEKPVTVDLTGGLGTADLDMSALAADRPTASATTPAEDTAGTIAALPSLPTVAADERPEWGEVTQDLEDMVVIVGAGEVGPYGSARTRFEVETTGDLTAAGVVELAWSTGLITWEDSPRAGWTVTATGEAIDEADIAERFRDEVLARVGVRTYADDARAEMFDNAAPQLTSVFLPEDLSFVVDDEAQARAYLSDDPENTVVTQSEDGEWTVTRKAGTEIRVPRRTMLTRVVGGQIPTGFDPTAWGIPADMVSGIDRVAAWNLVATVDAFISSGFTPAELLAHVHPADVANTQGTGMGGMTSMRSLYIDGILGRSRANDTLQEALPNVVAAHVMQSYVGGYGSMVHPVAACATTAVSVEEGFDKIRAGKAEFVVSGGFDDLSIEGIQGFADMSATADSAAMAAKGIDERYYSRANDRRRGGFVESAGGGTILLARGDVAARMGLPVLGVVGWAGSYADGAHTSIPAPGLGALGAGRGGKRSPLARGLAQLGLTADDVAVVSKHDTSTKANDPNESDLHERLAEAIGRSEGNPLFVVSQKTLTGHAKGGAAAFQLIGLTQMLRSGTIPPNRSLDCVDDVLDHHRHLVWLRETLQLGGDLPLKAGLLTSLGFGHVSGLIAVVHPEAYHRAVAAAYGEDEAERIREAGLRREREGARRLTDAIYGGEALYTRPEARRLGEGSGDEVKEREAAVLLDPAARVDADGVLSAGVAAEIAAEVAGTERSGR